MVGSPRKSSGATATHGSNDLILAMAFEHFDAPEALCRQDIPGAPEARSTIHGDVWLHEAAFFRSVASVSLDRAQHSATLP